MQNLACQGAGQRNNIDNPGPAGVCLEEESAVSISLCSRVRTSFFVRPSLCKAWIGQWTATCKTVFGCVGRVTA